MNSIWINSIENRNKFENLKENIEVDVCIVGAGIFGLTSAYYLTKQGFNVAVIDAGNIAEKVTGHTTAKITSQHNLIYKYLIDSVGIHKAKQYLYANQEAIQNIADIVKNEHIDCDFERQDNYVYTTDINELKKIQQENQAVQTLGFNSEFVTNTPLPFEVLGAIKFPNQAQFNPLKYAYGLADKIIQKSGKIYTNTIVYDIEKHEKSFISYTRNNTIKSKYVILASHYPFINNLGYYFFKMYQSTSYVIAVDTKSEPFGGMYINSKSPIFSYKFVPYNGKKLLLVGGQDHKTGSKIDLSTAYSRLETEVRKYYPNCEVLYKWNTEDCITLDKIPYIGEFSNLMPNMYVGTGFNKWGMTSSNVAANIVVDKILGQENKYEEVFKSTRLQPIKNNKEFGNMLKETVNSLVLNKFKIPSEDLYSIPIGTATIVEYEGKKIGIYKDKTCNLHAVKPICSHLGCLLSWNNIDNTWDCPCHGSRFDFEGHNLYGPAVKDLEKIDIEN